MAAISLNSYSLQYFMPANATNLDPIGLELIKEKTNITLFKFCSSNTQETGNSWNIQDFMGKQTYLDPYHTFLR